MIAHVPYAIAAPMANTRQISDAPRRETKTERKMLTLTPSVKQALEQFSQLSGKAVAAVIDDGALKEAKSLPIWGEVPCGPAREVEQKPLEFFNVGDMLEPKNGDFLIYARGDSMTGDGIRDGDLLMIRPQSTCRSNEIAIVLVQTPFGNAEATLKRVQFSESSPIVRLVPMNSEYETREIDTTKEEIQICGILCGLIRRELPF